MNKKQSVIKVEPVSTAEPKHSAMGYFGQVGLLMWKNLLLYSRRPISLLFEIGLPVFFAAIILAIRVFVKPEEVSTSTYYSRESLHTSYFESNVEIGFVPNYTNVQSVMSDVVTNFNSYATVTATGEGFDSESALETYYSSNTDKLRIAVVFSGLTSTATLPSAVTYTLRPATNDSEKWYTTRTYPFYQNNAPRDQVSDAPNYIFSSMVMIQCLVGEAILRHWSGTSSPTLDVYAHRMPYPPYYKDDMIGVIQTQLPLFLLLSFILNVIQTTKAIVMEKERKIKESMKLMGLKPSAHWTSWFLTCFLFLAVAMAIYAILFGIKLGSSGSVLGNSDISLFYVYLLCYAFALITFCFMISVIVSRANVGAAVAGILFFGFYFPYLFLTREYETMSQGSKIGLCFLFNMAMAFGANTIGLYEGTGEGAKWDNFYKVATVDDNFTLLNAMLMLLADGFIHLLITWYIDNVWPGEFGVPKPFYFCFTKHYWCGTRGDPDATYDTANEDHKHFEPDPTHLPPGIQICNLSKKFKNKYAVDNMRLKMYEGQITVLLGHNGAGKTTTMSMLTGFLPPSGGTALINGHDIRTDIEGVRKSLGLCPQHNILWDTLTVEEHLEFFARLKGSERSKVKKAVEEMVKEVGLEQKRRTESQHLSGGQKRKLSVGIALIADSKIVVLDEPSSGMDPAARRQAWEVLQRHRQGRTILLTTHYMDEADVLGDRIAIMSQGVVKCCGSSLFLKKLFGAGYHLVVVKDHNCNVPNLTQAIQSKIPSAQLEGEVNREVSYLLPDDQSERFADLFRFLEQQKPVLGIVGFGTSATTMEEVFLKVGENAEEDIADIGATGRPGTAKRPGTSNGFSQNVFASSSKENLIDEKKSEQRAHNKDNIMAFNQDYVKLTGWRLQWSHFKGMFIKKVILSWRHRIVSIVQLLLPVVFTVLALLIKEDDRNEETTLAFNLSPFGTTYIPYSNGSSPSISSESAAVAYASSFSSQTLRRVDLTSYSNMSEYILTLASSLGTSSYNKKVIVGALFEPPGTGDLVVTAYYNGQPYHGLPVAVSLLLNGLAQYYQGSSYSISTYINPLPKGDYADAEDSNTSDSTLGFLVGFCISFGMAFLTSSFIYFLVKEREVGAKHLQVVSGVGPVMFWLATLAWDYLNYLIPTFAMLCVFAAFSTDAYVDDNRLGLVLLVLLLYGLSALSFVYLLHFLFKSPATAFVLLIIFNILSGLVTTLAVFILYLPSLGTEDEAEIFNWIFMVLFPNYCMARSFMDIYSNYLTLEYCNSQNYKTVCPVYGGPCCKSYGTCSGTCLGFDEDYLAWERPGIGKFILFMVIHAVVFMSLVLAIEYGLFHRLASCLQGAKKSSKTADSSNVQLSYINGSGVTANAMEDSDVASERKRINDTPASELSKTDSLIMMNLTKHYGTFKAVENICLGVPDQECFGLLGQNGAGKTTTFKMLTGDVMVSSGNAYLKSYDIVQHIKKVQQNMGYCPQFDALLDQMTGRETLTMYARLRGVPDASIKCVVDSLIDIMMLQPHADKLAGQYSGGNKRKLSTAIALVGDPPFILLDEPSAGVDPAARRQLWVVLSQVRASGRTLVLTSHSMEECDALCTRIAIMVNGQFKCLGSPQHLKNKFGQGYTLVAKMGLTEEKGLVAPVQPVIDLVIQNFQGAKVFDGMQGYVHFQVPDADVHVADVFELMERAKRELHVEDYSVHQTTLEQVFLTFTRKQVPPKETPNRSILTKVCCCCCIAAQKRT